MIQVIAVHCRGTLPVVMELPTSGLDFVQQHALKFLPRSPSGVPELRALGKSDGLVQFRFKVPADKISVGSLPELLTQWDAKFTEATLKRIAKTNADERKAASAAGLWKGDGDKTELTTMHTPCNPDDARDLSEALATVVQKKTRVSTGVKRMPKPKLLDAVIEASTAVNPLTGEQSAIVSASERAVNTLRAREIVQLMAGAGEGGEDLRDPLENARRQDAPDLPVDAVLPVSTVLPDANVHKTMVPPWEDGVAPEFTREPGGSTYMSGAAEVLGVLQAHKEGKSVGPRLIEMSVDELKRRARGGGQAAAQRPALIVPKMPVLVDAGAAPVAAAGADGTNDQSLSEHGFAVDDGSSETSPEGFDLFEGYGEPVFFEKQEPAVVASPVEVLPASTDWQPSSVDWSGICSFRLSSSSTNGHSVILESGEVFEALAHLEVVEPLAVHARWFLEACKEDGVSVRNVHLLAVQTSWLKEQLQWRNKQLMRWLGKADLVPPVVAVTPGEKPKKSRRPAGWVDTGVRLASLAQHISMDIAMLDMTILDIERAITGMPSWAIKVMAHMRAFRESEATADVVAEPSGPGAAFRNAWRSELLRIDSWCAVFKPIKIARQFGLFASSADQKLLLRLEDLIARTKTWSAAPAQASRVLAVWLGFVLSLDHTAMALAGQVGPVAGESAQKNLLGLAELTRSAGAVAHG
jgi:hypothetical protein